MVSDFKRYPNHHLYSGDIGHTFLYDWGACFLPPVRHICHASLTMGILPAALGRAVITPHRRLNRAMQGSPQVYRGP